MGMERSEWISPLEVSDARFYPNVGVMYKDLTKIQGKNVIIKSREELPDEINWFQYYQILSIFENDKKKYGFKRKNSQLEEIILKNEEKLISKIYKQLITWHSEEELVKNSMIKWATNFNRPVMLSSWEYL